MSVVHGVRVNARRAIAAALVGVAGAVGAVMLVLSLAGSSDSIEVRLGDDDFRGIDAADLADEIADHGPVPFPDLLGRNRSIWVIFDLPSIHPRSLVLSPLTIKMPWRTSTSTLGTRTGITLPPLRVSTEAIRCRWHPVSGE